MIRRPIHVSSLMPTPGEAVCGAVVCFLLAAFSGCGGTDGPTRVLVSGQVIYDGQPVQDGRIRFVPTSANPAPVSIAFIKDGSYTTADAGGVPVGVHRVEILAYDPKEVANRQPGFGQPAPRQLLPAKYNKDSQLLLEVVTAGGSMEHDFILKK